MAVPGLTHGNHEGFTNQTPPSKKPMKSRGFKRRDCPAWHSFKLSELLIFSTVSGTALLSGTVA